MSEQHRQSGDSDDETREPAANDADDRIAEMCARFDELLAKLEVRQRERRAKLEARYNESLAQLEARYSESLAELEARYSRRSEEIAELRARVERQEQGGGQELPIAPVPDGGSTSTRGARMLRLPAWRRLRSAAWTILRGLAIGVLLNDMTDRMAPRSAPWLPYFVDALFFGAWAYLIRVQRRTMFVPPKVEKPTRTMIGHVIREEFEDLENEMRKVGDETFKHALMLCVYAAGYIAFDVAERRPTDADLREIARHTSVSAGGFELSQDDVFAFLSRVALAGESMAEVFPMEEGIPLPLKITSTLLLAFRPRDKHWWEYLDDIWSGLDAAALADMSMLPALMLFSDRDKAKAARKQIAARPAAAAG